ncbi:MAG TPA: hypothetical protein VHS80_13890, partial [Chthoniobacterales bacterium]|nr:hypothetical protein [Chthoniobacterales bacterium]
RILQIYDPNSVATCFGAGLAKGKVGILRNNGFEIVTSEAIIACGAGEHAQTSDALEKRRAEMRARFGE